MVLPLDIEELTHDYLVNECFCTLQLAKLTKMLSKELLVPVSVICALGGVCGLGQCMWGGPAHAYIYVLNSLESI
jgi:hypothetical protein